MAIPGKDNGCGIEGRAVNGRRLLLGLRGPVLRGPVLRGGSTLLEIQVEALAEDLRLLPLDDGGTLLRKHFLPLDGLDIRVFTWPGARPALAANREPVRFEEALTGSVPLPHARGVNRAEAICQLPPALSGGKTSWLVLYDAAGPEHRDGELAMFGKLRRRD